MFNTSKLAHEHFLGCSVLYVLMAVMLMSMPLISHAEPLSIHVLDVGEGQSVLLHKNNRGILLDTGHAGVAMSVLQRLETLQIKELDYLMLTHLHPDHASGYFRIAEAFPQAMVVDNCQPLYPSTTPDMMRWVNHGLARHPKRRCVKAGDELEWQGVKISVLWPVQTPTIEGGINHQSLVLLLEYGQQTLLVMGDADLKAEAEILKQRDLNPVDVLIVGHHGSVYASSEGFLQSVRPQHSVISINADNFRGYPSPQTLQKLSIYSKHVHKTYESGEIQFRFEEIGD